MIQSDSKPFDKILLIEDDGAHALIISRALRQVASTVLQASSLVEGLEVLEADKVDLIVTDLHLPDSGEGGPLATLGAKAPEVPVVVLTASTALSDAVKALRNGARDFIVKTFDGNFKEVLALSLTRLFASISIERERQRLQHEMEVLRVSVENSNDGLALLDRTGKIRYANRSFRMLLSVAEGGDSKIGDLFTAKVVRGEQTRASLLEKLGSFTAGSVWTTELLFTHDQSIAYELTLSALPTPGEETFAIWTHNRTQDKRREKFQREILSTTTHDLKGPLGAILISTELLQGMVPSEGKAHQLVLRVASSAQGAVNLIDEFLSARRIQEGTFILRPSPHDLALLSKDAIGDFVTIATARQIHLEVAEATGDTTAKVDKLGTVRVISNLLSNAMKFTPKGGKVSLAVRGESDEVHLIVSDSGCGMEPSEVQRLFERFSRLEKHSEVAGTGLGLFVVRSIVSAHGGRIDVTSKVGEGTTFDVVLPKNPPVNERGELISLSFA